MTCCNLLGIDFIRFFRYWQSAIFVIHSLVISLFHSSMFLQSVSTNWFFIHAHTFSMGFRSRLLPNHL